MLERADLLARFTPTQSEDRQSTNAAEPIAIRSGKK
jgi:hypothetical protein